ncbi:helix-turn-helix domain-containing protein [Insolitispirillum peregrinum]|uniref:helix-turn-helix domain-containing protein n=1 Tax=Insolitispirillum peregrinum TaxID=80876 RepID=UPI000971192B
MLEFGWKGSSPRLSCVDESALVHALTERLYTTTAEIVALVESRFGISYSRSGMIKLLSRLGFEYRNALEGSVWLRFVRIACGI